MHVRKVSVCLAVAALTVTAVNAAAGQTGSRATPSSSSPDATQRAERAADEIEQRLGASPQFAGVYLGRGERPTVNVTGSHLGERARASGADVRVVDVALSRLRNAERRLQRSLGQPGGSAVVDISENNVYVYPPAGGLSGKARQAVGQVRRSGITVEVEGRARPLKKAYHGALGLSHTRGNLRTVCAGGFNVSNRAGYPMVVTAGHCGRVDSVWHRLGDGKRVGKITRRSFVRVRRNDWALIRASKRYTHPAAVRHGSPAQFQVKNVRRLGKLREGKGLCRNGPRSHTRCGRIKHISPGNFFRSGVCARQGDSGGPAYRRIPGTRRVEALGILSGGSGRCGQAGSYTLYQPLREVLRKENLRLRTRP